MTTKTTHHPDPSRILKAIAKRSMCTLGTVSPAGRPHVAAVIYQLVDDRLYISTTSTSRKARNLADHPHVAVAIPVRRLPFGAPPSTIQFQATATLLATDDHEITTLVSDRQLDAISGHGELDLPDGCFIRIDLPRRLHTYGLGMSMMELARHPLDGRGEVTRSMKGETQATISRSESRSSGRTEPAREVRSSV